jgi:phosphoglycerate dehydrogenase-like enzyme
MASKHSLTAAQGKLNSSTVAPKNSLTVPAIEEDIDNFTIGLIGLGDMGKMYANRLSAAGWR